MLRCIDTRNVRSCPDDASLMVLDRQIYGEQSFLRTCFTAEIFHIIFYGIPCLLMLYSLINKRDYLLFPTNFLLVISYKLIISLSPFFFPWFEKACHGCECEHELRGERILEARPKFKGSRMIRSSIVTRGRTRMENPESSTTVP